MNIIDAAKNSLRSLYNTLPILLGVVLLIGLFTTLIPARSYVGFFGQNPLLDAARGSFLGSLLAGNPITSYVLGGEFLKEGVSLVAVTSFILAWVTVGVVQIPAEAAILGKRFALFRNFVNFLFSIIIAILVVYMLEFLGW